MMHHNKEGESHLYA